MELTVLANILISTLFLLLFFCIELWLYRRYRIAKYRRDIFVLRDKLFDEAADGLIAFDHPAYQLLRLLMNGHLRFAHKITLWQPVFLFLFDKFRGPIPSKGIAFEDDFNIAIRDLDLEIVSKLSRYKFALEMRTLSFVYFSIPEFVLLILPIGIASLIHAAAKGIVLQTVSIAKSAIETRVTDAAYALGKS